MNKWLKRMNLGAAAAVVLLAGCSSPEGASNSAGGSAGKQELTEINILTTTYNSAPGNDLDSLK